MKSAADAAVVAGLTLALLAGAAVPSAAAAFISRRADRPTHCSGGAPRMPTSLEGSKRGGGAMSRKKKSRGKASGGGFGVQADEPPSSSSAAFASASKPGGGSIYSLPALYDLAFGYRNYDEEVRFLLRAHGTHSTGADGGEGAKVLELAAGPARHSLTALSRLNGKVSSVTAVDMSKDMVAYGTENADMEFGTDGPRREAFRYVLGDMRTFSAGADAATYDTAWILLGSMQHLLTNDDVVSTFASAHAALRPGGTLIVELPHPRETFSMVECTRNGWEVPLEDEAGENCGELKIVWGDDDDTFDPIRQIRDFTVAMELVGMEEAEEGTDMQSVKEVVPMRLFTAQEIDALARCAGLEVMSMYGALALLDKDDDDEDADLAEEGDNQKTVDVNDEEEAFRLVCVLRRPPEV